MDQPSEYQDECGAIAPLDMCVYRRWWAGGCGGVQHNAKLLRVTSEHGARQGTARPCECTSASAAAISAGTKCSGDPRTCAGTTRSAEPSACASTGSISAAAAYKESFVATAAVAVATNSGGSAHSHSIPQPRDPTTSLTHCEHSPTAAQATTRSPIAHATDPIASATAASTSPDANHLRHRHVYRRE